MIVMKIMWTSAGAVYPLTKMGAVKVAAHINDMKTMMALRIRFDIGHLPLSRQIDDLTISVTLQNEKIK